MNRISLATSLSERVVTPFLDAYSVVKDRNVPWARRCQLRFYRRLLLRAWFGRPWSFQLLERLASKHGAASLVTALRALADGNVSWAQLRELSSAIHHTGDNGLYESMIGVFDRKLSLGSLPRQGAFVGRGIGAGSLNAYRKIKGPNGVLFEKIYLRRSAEYRRSNWFYSNIFHCLRNSSLKVPAVVTQRDGELLSAKYFQFAQLRSVELSQFLERALRVDRSLYELPAALLEAAPEEVVAFSQRGKYKAGYRAAARFIEEYDLGRTADLQVLEGYVMGLAKKVSHGDLSPFNLCQGGEVVDWDSCGLDPLGHDLGYAVTRCLEPVDPAELVSFFEQVWQLRGEGAQRVRHDFVFSAIFFAFIYYARSSSCQVSDETLGGLFRYCYDVLPKPSLSTWQAGHTLELADA